MRPHTLALWIALASATSTVLAQDRPVDLTITEGTNLAAALSPDGKTLAIDLLGRIWVLPASGGSARALTDELGDARQPAWSPDGKRIAFQSYRDGTWHIWSVGADGSDLRQHTSGMFDHREPDWSADGRSLVFSSDRAGNYDLWELDLASGKLERLTDDPGDDFGPSCAKDGSIAFVSTRKSSPGIYVRQRDGAVEQWVAATGQLAGPSWSPDGRLIAFNQFDRGASAIVVAERGGSLKPITKPDDDGFPFRAAWLSSEELLYTGDGLIQRARVGGERLGSVPFNARISFVRHGYQRAKRNWNPGPATAVRGIVGPAMSPDGRRIAFTALGDLWLLTDGKPAQLTHDPYIQVDPAWSPDGSKLVYTSDRSGVSELWIRDLTAGTERQLTTSQAGAALPAWSPDGRRIVFQAQRGLATEVRMIEVATGEIKTLRADLFGPSRASFSPDGKTIAVAALHPNSARFREGRNEILLISLEGGPDRWFVPLGERGIGTRGSDGPVWSPDGTRMALIAAGILWSLPVTSAGEPAGPAVPLSVDLAGDPSWSADSKTLFYQSTDGLRTVSIADGSTTAIPLDLKWQRWNPSRRIVVHAGRLWNGVADAPQTNVDLVIRGNRIAELVPHSAALHRDSVVDGSRLTVIPGLADAHAHLGFGTGEALGRTWLAYGITTVRDPASEPFQILERRESVESGVRVGPRELATGRIFDGDRIYYNFNNGLSAGAQLDLELDRADRFRFDLIKTYVRFPDILQRRVIEFAHRHGIAVSSHELYPAVAFGADHVEHIRGTSRRGYSPKTSALYRSYQDVTSLLIGSKMSITPTMGIQGGFFNLITRDSTVLDDPRLLIAYGPTYVQSLRSIRAGGFGSTAAMIGSQGRLVRSIVSGGGRVVAGTDAPIIPYGLSLLTELQHYVDGGLKPVEALRTATSGFAEAMGESADLGSVAVGKLADLTLVEGNPLDQIADVRKTRIVIKNGEVFTVDQLLKGAIDRASRGEPKR